MAGAPSRALVIFGDGLMPHVTASHRNLHSLASKGCCGFLALRCRGSGVTEEADLVQLLDLHDSYKGGDDKVQSMSERFTGMKAAMFTNSEAAGAVGKLSGFAVTTLDDHKLPDSENMASRCLEMLGLEGSGLSEPDCELLLVHVLSKDDRGPGAASWVDELVGKLMDKENDHLLLIVVFGYGGAVTGAETQLEPADPALVHLRPTQSSSMKAGKLVGSVRNHHPLVAVYHQNAVTRRDHCREFTREEFHKSCGNLAILADRFLYEVAFKLWKAPKYGA